MAPADARQLSKTFLLRLRALDGGTDEYQYVRNTLIEMNLSLVRHVARRFTRRSQPVDDILQVGTIGLIKAIDRWRPSRNVEFTTLAVPYIQGEIKRFFRDTTWAVRVPRRLQEMRIEIARAREQLEAEGVQEPSAAQLAGRIGADEGEVTEGLVACNGYACLPPAGPPVRQPARTTSHRGVAGIPPAPPGRYLDHTSPGSSGNHRGWERFFAGA
ncbi:sigma-70 family RNA polymerase sigma factor [Streptomyces lydicus]|uniref:sigma-70 family RNA polymerase sigma factor n=1 Tax=Streptomyces lydicus TaxID=47763 RepID=UPI00378FD856